MNPYLRYKLSLQDADKEAQQQEKINQKKLEKKKQQQEEKAKANEQRLLEHIKIKEESEFYGQSKFNNQQNEVNHLKFYTVKNSLFNFFFH